MNVVEPFVRQAIAAPGLPALVAGDRTISYGELLVLVRQLAAALRAAGVGPGDRVALVVTRPAGNVALTLALGGAGAVSVGVPGGLGRAELEPLLASVGATHVLHDRPEPLGLSHDGFKGELRFDALVAGSATAVPVRFERAEPGAMWRISVSSGTTGTPKGIAYSHGATLLNVHLQRVLFPTGPGDRMMIALGLASGFALNYWLRCLHSGACAVLRGEGTPNEVLRLVHEQQVTHVVSSPNVAMAMAESARQPGGAHGSPAPALRLMNVGGAKLSPQLYGALRRHICPNLMVNYGATETYLLAVLDPQLQEQHPEAAGRLLPWVEAQALDAQGRPLPPGQAGALRFRSPALAIGYVGPQDPGQPSAFRDGWFHSTDLGSVSADGIVRLTGRASEVINIGGVKFDPGRVEELILQDHAIRECVVVEVPGKLGQPQLVAVVVADDGADLAGVRRRCAQAGGIVVPARVLQARLLPRNAGGKVMRERVRSNVLRQLASEPAAAAENEPEERP